MINQLAWYQRQSWFNWTVAIVMLVLLVLATIWSNPGSDYGVSLRSDPMDPSITNVYVVDMASKEEALFISLSGVLRDYYHPAEFHDGTLYILQQSRTAEGQGGDLWRYSEDGRGTMISSGKTLDFRVAPRSNWVAALQANARSSSDLSKTVVLIDPGGNVVKRMQSDDLRGMDPSKSLSLVSWQADTLQLVAQQGRALTDVYGLGTRDQDVLTYDVATLGIIGSEFAVEVDAGILIFSDYVPSFETDGIVGTSNDVTSLYFYDLHTGARKTLLTAPAAHEFSPVLVGSDVVEYSSPDGSGRARMSLRGL